MHNGVIHNYREIARANGLMLRTQCDSEVLARFIENAEGSYATRLAKAMEPVMGACAVVGIWGDKVYLARKGNPLHFSRVGKRSLYFASLGQHLPGKDVHSLKDWQVTTVKIGDINVSASAKSQRVHGEPRQTAGRFAGGLLF